MSIYSKILIKIEVFENFDQHWDFIKIFDYVNSFKRISILEPIFRNLSFNQNFRKISILAKIFEKLDFRENIQKSRF